MIDGAKLTPGRVMILLEGTGYSYLRDRWPMWQVGYSSPEGEDYVNLVPVFCENEHLLRHYIEELKSEIHNYFEVTNTIAYDY